MARSVLVPALIVLTADRRKGRGRGTGAGGGSGGVVEGHEGRAGEIESGFPGDEADGGCGWRDGVRGEVEGRVRD